MFHSPAAHCQEIVTEGEFLSLRASWNSLLAQCSYPTPFCSWEWAWEWWRSFGKNAVPAYRLLVVQAYDTSGSLIGLAPFFFPANGAGPLRLRPLRPLATRIHCMVDDLTDEPLILLHRKAAEAALQGVMTALLRWTGKGGWDLIHLRWIRRASDPDLESLWRQISYRRSFLLVRPRRQEGQTRALPTEWAEFRRSLHRSMRDNLPYYPRLLTREGHDWDVKIARTPEEVAKAAPLVISLHTSRAQSERGPVHVNHMPSEAHRQFFLDTLTRLAFQGMAAVAVLEVAGVPIAAQSVLEFSGRLTMYYSGFEPDWHRYSPVMVLQTALLQDAMAHGITEIDYLPGAEPWKTRWGTQETYVLDELSCLSLSPRTAFRSLWRVSGQFLDRLRGISSECGCGFCTLEEQEAVRLVRAQSAAETSMAANAALHTSHQLSS